MKRIFNSVMIVAMLVWALGGVLTAPVAHAASAGSLIKMAGNPAVYYLGADSKRYVFPNQATYNSWYSDFSGVVTVSDTEMYSYAIGGNVTVRPGTKLIKITTDPKVYAVEPGGSLRHVPSEAVAADLFGANWNKLVIDLADAFFAPPTYQIGAALTTMYPTGSLVKESGSATVYYIDGSTKRPIADAAAMSANKFMDANVHTHDLSGYTAGTSITGAEAAITTVAGVGSVVVTPDANSIGTLTVSLASDTPASATLVQNAALVKFTKVNFSATGGDVTIDSVQIKRMGLSNDSNLASVYLLDSNGTMWDSEKSIGSLHTAYVTKDITVTSGTTKSFWLAANMHTTLQSGERVSLAVSEVNVKGSATVVGALPVNGNEMTMNSSITIGSVTPADGGLANTGATTTKAVGTTNYTLSSLRLSANSTEDVQVERIRWYQSGTAGDADVTNLKMYVDGVLLGTVAQAADKYVDFDLSSSPFSIAKGTNKTFELKGDLTGGSSRTVDFEIYNQADVLVKGKTYGFYSIPVYGTTSAPYWTQSAITAIGNGTLTVSKAVLASTNVAEGAQQQPLGIFNFQAQGEGIIVSRLIMELTTSTNTAAAEVTNLTLYDENGAVVSGPVDPTTSASPDTFTFTDTFTVPVGTHKYTVKGDLDSDWTANETIKLGINPVNTKITAKGETTNNTITASPSAEITGDTVSVKTADLNVSVSSFPAAQTVAAGTNGFLFSSFVLDASQSGEDIRVTQIKTRHVGSAADLHDDITGITLYDKDAPTVALNTPQAGESDNSSDTATSTITLTNPLIITKGSTKTIYVKGDISGSAVDATWHKFGMYPTGITAFGNTTSNSVAPDYTEAAGSQMLITTGGTLRMVAAGINPAEGVVIADSTNTVGVFSFDALYENVEVQKLGLTISSGTTSYKNISKLQLYESGTLLGEVPVTGANATITPSNLILTANASARTLTLKAVLEKVGPTEAGISGNNFVVTITGVDAKGKATGNEATKSGLDSAATKAQYVFKTKPSITWNDLTGSVLNNSRANLFKFTVGADSKGDVGFYKATFAVSTNSVDLANYKLYEFSTGADLSDTVLDAGNERLTDTKYAINAVIDTSLMGGAKEYTTIAAGTEKAYVLKADVTNWNAANDSISVEMISDNAAATVDNTDAIEALADDNFIWSDLNYEYSTPTATLTKQWVNGYKVFTTTTAETFSY